LAVSWARALGAVSSNKRMSRQFGHGRDILMSFDEIGEALFQGWRRKAQSFSLID